MKQFLYVKLYDSPGLVEEREQSVEALEQLFHFYMEHPQQMPKYYFDQSENTPRHRVVCDYIAGMTDHFLLRLHRDLVARAM